MFERFRSSSTADNADNTPGNGRTAVAERPADRRGRGSAAATAPITREHMRDVRARQRAEYGGINWGAAFFGWLVAVGLTVLLGVLAGAATAAIGANPATGTVVTVVVLLVAYFTGGYVAGRLARFDGARNGFLTWVIGVLASLVLAVLGVFVGAQYDVLNRVPLPTLPTSLEQVTGPGLVLVAVAVLGTLVAAALGGKTGEGFHRRVDRAATDAL